MPVKRALPLLLMMLLLSVLIGWYLMSTGAPSQDRNEASSSSPGDGNLGSFVEVDGYQFTLTPLAPCGALDSSTSGVLAGSFDDAGLFLPEEPQLMLHAGAGYSYAAFYPGPGGMVVRPTSIRTRDEYHHEVLVREVRCNAAYCSNMMVLPS